MPRVLVADDQPDIVAALRLLLETEGFAIASAESPSAVMTLVQETEFDALLLDLNYTRDTTSGREGFELLDRLANAGVRTPVVVMTAWGSIEGAVEAMRRGARDYVEKPWNNAQLLATLRGQIDGPDQPPAVAPERDPHWICASPAMQELRNIAERIAPSDANVLITGEHGSGKEVLARWIHARSARQDKPWVTMNAGAVSDGVFESELFGHTQGAFTDAKANRVGVFELADGGTLFLDEIANMSPAQQPKLLRVLETGEFQRVGSSATHTADVRVLAATNADLTAEVAAGNFREDLLYRLNTVELWIPPLRRRPEDLPRLIDLFLRRTATRYARAIEGISPEAMTALRAHPWPGNVRELEHVIERAVLLSRSHEIGVRDLGLRPTQAPSNAEELTLEDAERLMIERALERFAGNVSRAAQHLGLSRSALYRRMSKFGL